MYKWEIWEQKRLFHFDRLSTKTVRAKSQNREETFFFNRESFDVFFGKLFCSLSVLLLQIYHAQNNCKKTARGAWTEFIHFRNWAFWLATVDVIFHSFTENICKKPPEAFWLKLFIFVIKCFVWHKREILFLRKLQFKKSYQLIRLTNLIVVWGNFIKVFGVLKKGKKFKYTCVSLVVPKLFDHMWLL